MIRFSQIAFMTDLLLENHPDTRAWFAEFVSANKKRKIYVLKCIRDELLKQLQSILSSSVNVQLLDVVKGAAILRLYCALHSITRIKSVRKNIHYCISSNYFLFPNSIQIQRWWNHIDFAIDHIKTAVNYIEHSVCFVRFVHDDCMSIIDLATNARGQRC